MCHYHAGISVFTFAKKKNIRPFPFHQTDADFDKGQLLHIHLVDGLEPQKCSHQYEMISRQSRGTAQWVTNHSDGDCSWLVHILLQNLRVFWMTTTASQPRTLVSVEPHMKRRFSTGLGRLSWGDEIRDDLLWTDESALPTTDFHGFPASCGLCHPKQPASVHVMEVCCSCK